MPKSAELLIPEPGASFLKDLAEIVGIKKPSWREKITGKDSRIPEITTLAFRIYCWVIMEQARGRVIISANDQILNALKNAPIDGTVDVLTNQVAPGQEERSRPLFPENAIRKIN